MDKISKIINRQFENKQLPKNFQLTQVVSNLGVQEISKPFKKLKFENTEEIKFEKNKNIETSMIISEFSFSSEEPKEKELLTNSIDNEIKNSELMSSEKSEKFPIIYSWSSNSLKFPEEILDGEVSGSTKNTNQDEKRKECISYTGKDYLNFLPSKKFCKNCNCEVHTKIKMEMPTLSL